MNQVTLVFLSIIIAVTVEGERVLYSSVGCYKDTQTRAVPTLEGTPLLKEKYKDRIDPVNKCAVAALLKGYKVFTVQDGGWCGSSPTAETTYQQYGVSSGCLGGEGGPMANDVYKLHGSVKTLGCFKDTGIRAISTLEGTDPILDGYYSKRTNPLLKCAYAALKRGFKVFALQNGGWCASTQLAVETYKMYGPSTACKPDGEGGLMSNQVYAVIYDDWYIEEFPRQSSSKLVNKQLL